MEYALFATMLFWALVFLSALYWVPKLVLNYWRRRNLLARLVSENGWIVDKGKSEDRPPELTNETFSNIAKDDDDYYDVNVTLRIDGNYRDREFLLMTYSQRRAARRRGAQPSGSTYIFTPLQDGNAFPPMFIHMNSKMLDGVMAIDSAAKASSGQLRAFPVVSMPSPFSEKYTVRGLSGTREFLTQNIQAAILERPHIFIRNEEKWYRRSGTLPGLTERYAYLDIQDLNPHTLTNRLESLMDWADIVDPKPKV